jgi:hypothetical protein
LISDVPLGTFSEWWIRFQSYRWVDGEAERKTS